MNTNTSKPTPSSGNARNVKILDELDDEYEFYRPMVKSNIFSQSNINDRSILATWLHKCDVEKNKALRCGFIKLLLVSLQHPGGNFLLFRRSAPKRMPYLENCPLYLSEVVEDELSRLSEWNNRAIRRRTYRHAAVSSDLTSFASSMSTKKVVQVFYASSDNPINTWILPSHVPLPVDSRSAPEWERALSAPLKTVNQNEVINNRNWMNTEDGPIFIPTPEIGYWNMSTTSETEMTPMERTCRRLMGEQIPLVQPKKEEFHWYEHSRLDGTTILPTNEICIDKDTCGHEKTQLELDERAISVMNKVYPGRVQLVLDSRLITDVTGVRMDPTVDIHNGLNDHRMTLNIDATDCIRPNRGESDAQSSERRIQPGDDRSPWSVPTDDVDGNYWAPEEASNGRRVGRNGDDAE